MSQNQGGNIKCLFNRKNICICLFLSIITFISYFDVINHDFITFDDDLNVTENPNVQSGLSIDNIKWAFKFTAEGDKHYWHPLTSISHMIDCHVFGLKPAGHHFTNLLLHLCNTLLLFIVFLKMTSDQWKSFCIVIFFALHPLNVESVAWLAERKNVLSTLFWFLAMLSYLHFLKKQNLIRYIFILICMFLGLLCKPIIVVLPCVLLLIDLWPLKRIQFTNLKTNNISSAISTLFPIIVEKIPLVMLSALWIYLSSSSMQNLGVVIPFEQIPMDLRIANGIVSYIKYIEKIFWPFNLSIYYPFPSKTPPFWQIAGASSLLIIFSFFAIKAIKTSPWLTVGWFWYFGTLFPAIGLVQNGLWPSMADRWTYIPHIGLYIIIIWSLSLLLNSLALKKILLTILSILMLLQVRIQVGYWNNDIKLFQHAVSIQPDNIVALNNLGGALIKSKKIAEGIAQYKKAIQINPYFKEAHYNIGRVYADLKKNDIAIKHFQAAINIDPKYSEAYNNLGSVLIMEGRFDEAEKKLLKSLEINNALAPTHYNIGLLQIKQGKIDNAIKHLQIAIDINSKFINAYNNLGSALLMVGRNDEAENVLVKLLEINDTIAPAHYNLGILLMRKGKIDEAIKHFSEAVHLNPEISDFHEKLNTAVRIKHQFKSKVQHSQKGLSTASQKP